MDIDAFCYSSNEAYPAIMRTPPIGVSGPATLPIRCLCSNNAKMDPLNRTVPEAISKPDNLRAYFGCCEIASRPTVTHPLSDPPFV